MLDFCASQGVEVLTAPYPMCQVDEAAARMEANNAHYRALLESDAVLRCTGAPWTQRVRIRPSVLMHSAAR
jgi:hypothetical protein